MKVYILYIFFIITFSDWGSAGRGAIRGTIGVKREERQNG